MISALMPCRGRHEETLALVPRLFKTARVEFELLLFVDDDPKLLRSLTEAKIPCAAWSATRVGYWTALSSLAKKAHGALFVNLANDLLPGVGWLERAYKAHLETFQGTEGIIGFNDGVHVGESAAHFLANKELLKRWYGEDYYPQAYHHMYGDTEICYRAMQEGRFAVANFALLFHNHPYNGRSSDPVYMEGNSQFNRDSAVYNKRREQGWN